MKEEISSPHLYPLPVGEAEEKTDEASRVKKLRRGESVRDPTAAKFSKARSDLTEEPVVDRAADREKWPGANEAHQGEDEKVCGVAIDCFRAMKFGTQFPESAQPIRAALFFYASA